MSNLERYKKELADLLRRGAQLDLAMRHECAPKELRTHFETTLGKERTDQVLKELPRFSVAYQAWYSEAKALIRQVLPDRLADFVAHYEAPKRKELSAHSYRIADYILSHSMSLRGEVVAGPIAAVSHFEAQVAIVKAVESRFTSALFDIRQLVQADLFDSELDAARSLLTHGYERAAGAMAGVVLEHHLTEVCAAHSVKLTKKSPTLADLSEALKAAGAIETPQWRFLQLFADIRNKCDHKKSADPTAAEVTDLLDGVAKIIKTVH